MPSITALWASLRSSLGLAVRLSGALLIVGDAPPGVLLDRLSQFLLG